LKVSLSSLLKFTLFLALGIFLVWLSVKGISADEWADMRNAFHDLRYGWIALSVLFAILSHVSRSHRWQMMLEPLGKKPSFKNCFLVLMVGYLANLAFPRLGEAARVGLIQKYEGIPFEKVLGTVIIDRAIDVLSLGILLGVVFVVEKDRLGNYAQETIFQPLAEKLGASANLGLVALFGGLVIAGVAWYLIKRLGIGAKAKSFVGNVFEGFATIAKLKNFPLFIFHSIFIWVMYYLMIYVVFFSADFSAGLSPMAGLSGLVFGAFAVVATPGGIGAYPIVMQSVIGEYGVSPHLAYGLGTLAWLIQTVVILAIGFLSFIALPIFNRDVERTDKQ